MELRPARFSDFPSGNGAVVMTEALKQSVQRAEPLLDFAHRETLLKRSFIFKDLPPEVLTGLAQIAKMRRLEDEQVLFQQGDDGDALFAVVEGLIRISVVGRGGKSFTLALMEPGDVFGEIALLDGLSRTASAEAAAPSLLLVIERSAFLATLERDGRLARHIIELLCDRLRENTDRLSEFAFLDLGARLASKLQALAIAHGHETKDGMRIELKLSQTELAEMLGVTREAINKQLKHWSKANLIRVERGYITVTDRLKLATLARSDDD